MKVISKIKAFEILRIQVDFAGNRIKWEKPNSIPPLNGASPMSLDQGSKACYQKLQY